MTVLADTEENRKLPRLLDGATAVFVDEDWTERARIPARFVRDELTGALGYDIRAIASVSGYVVLVPRPNSDTTEMMFGVTTLNGRDMVHLASGDTLSIRISAWRGTQQNTQPSTLKRLVRSMSSLFSRGA